MKNHVTIKTILAILAIILFIKAHPKTEVASEIKNITRTIPKNSEYSILIYNPFTSDTLYSYNTNGLMIPASLVKLFTTATAFSLFGDSHNFKTSILTDDNNIKDGIINGNLYIKGEGNFLFTSEDMDSLVNELRNIGIYKIEGNIIGDNTLFDSLYYQDYRIRKVTENLYLPPLSALTINQNVINLTLQSDPNPRKKVEYTIYPEASLIKIDLNAKRTKYKSKLKYHAAYNNNLLDVKISGRIRNQSKPIKYEVNIKNPALFATLLLKEKLLKKHITVKGEAYLGKVPNKSKEICYSAVPISKLIAVINKRSNNFVAENLFKYLGAVYNKEQKNYYYAKYLINNFMLNNDISSNGTFIVDGSGISRENKITATTLNDLLKSIYFNDRIFNEFYNSLSISGVDGTLNYLFNGSDELTGKFHGKSGTLKGVSSVAGYLRTSHNQNFIITIIIKYNKKHDNYYRKVQKQIIETVYKEL